MRLNFLRLIFITLSTCVLVVGSVFAYEPKSSEPVSIIIPLASSEDINHEDYYFRRILSLALDATIEQFGPYQLEQYDQFLADNRLRRELRRGELNVIWSPLQDTYGCEILPIRISLLKELNDYRVLLIREGDQPIFNKVQNLDDLRGLQAGMGSQWPDAEVLRSNKMPLVVAPGYGKLFRMLAENRFDYFARGLFQASTEVNFYPELNLVIEQQLMLHYKNPYHFFVSYDNAALAERLRIGLSIIQADGRFDTLFHSIPRHQWGLEMMKSGQRRIFELKPVENSTRVADSSRSLCGIPMISGKP